MSNSIEKLSNAALLAEMERRKAQKQGDREAYKELVAETLPKLFQGLLDVSNLISKVKTDVFKDVNNILALKQKAYGIKDGQQSHTFTAEDGKGLTVGYRVTDGWDDTVHAGIAKINDFIASLAKDEDTAKLVKAVNNLLKKDAKGNLKANRVVELQQMADDFNSPVFNDAIAIIVQAYKPVKSCYFIEASYTDATGKKMSMPLSFSAADFVKNEKQQPAVDLSYFKSLKS